MTSVLLEEDTKVARMKQKLMNDVHGKEETRSFLTFPRENLSISQSDLEQGFNKHRFRPKRNTILSTAAFLIALLCLGLETWRLHCSLSNTKDIEELKRDVEGLKHRFLEEDLLDELKAFKEQLYAEEPDDEDDPGAAEIGNTEYDSDYDEGAFPSDDYLLNFDAPPVYGARPSDFPDSSSTIAPVPFPPDPLDKDVKELLAAVHKNEAKHGPEYKKHTRDGHRSGERERSGEERKKKVHAEKLGEQKNNTKHKRDVSTPEELVTDWRVDVRRNSKNARNHGKRTISASEGRDSLEEKTAGEEENTSILVRGRHPPKKYYTPPFWDVAQPSPNGQNLEAKPKKSSRRLRKNLHMPKQIYAVHYEADSSESNRWNAQYTGNGRLRHESSVFTAWKPSDWVSNLNMNNYFIFDSSKGTVKVEEPGLYLAYAQIHYMDEHNEFGFHLLVNNTPILQCMIYHHIDRERHANRNIMISQSCFSAQLTYLKKGDILTLKEVGSSRFVIFHSNKSFFGLVKLGESRALK